MILYVYSSDHYNMAVFQFLGSRVCDSAAPRELPLDAGFPVLHHLPEDLLRIMSI